MGFLINFRKLGDRWIERFFKEAYVIILMFYFTKNIRYVFLSYFIYGNFDLDKLSFLYYDAHLYVYVLLHGEQAHTLQEIELFMVNFDTLQNFPYNVIM